MKMSFTAAVSKFFGRKTPTQTIGEFSEEIKALTPKDKEDLKVGLAKEYGVTEWL